MISVIIITLNRCQFLKNCLEALTKQKRLADEVVIVDNGSTDNTGKVVSQFQKRLPLKYLYEKKRGYGTARNVGVKNANGDIILFIDDDCLADENWILNLTEELAKGKAGIVGGSRTILKKNIFSVADYLCTVAPPLHPNLKKEERANLSTSNLGVKREVFKKVGYFNEGLPLAEDRDFCLRAKAMGFQLMFLPQALVVDCGSACDFKTYLERMKRYGFGTMISFLLHRQAEPLSRFFPENIAFLAFFSPLYILLEAVYIVSKNLRHSKKVLLFIPLILLGQAAWHYGSIMGVKEKRCISNV